MKEQDDFLKFILQQLDACQIDYMITGSFASSIHGQPRTTNDTDIIICPNREQLQQFVVKCSSKGYVSNPAAMDALENKSMFNVIDLEDCWKVDLIIYKDNDFQRAEFDRKVAINLGGENVFMISAEDVILSKLLWAKDSGSDLQFKDALSVAIVQWSRLDKKYLETWAEKLNIADELNELLTEAEKLQSE